MGDFLAYELLPVILNMTLTASVVSFLSCCTAGIAAAPRSALRALAGGAVPAAVPGVADGGHLPDGPSGHAGDGGDRPHQRGGLCPAGRGP